jgi:hypothetical protein
MPGDDATIREPTSKTLEVVLNLSLFVRSPWHQLDT